MTKIKLRTVIKAFLCANKGKKYSANEIAEFVNTNYFGMTKQSFSSISIGRFMNDYKHYPVFREIQRERPHNKTTWRYWVE